MEAFMELLQGYMMPAVLLACLLVGWVIKHCTPMPNKYIPLVVMILGALLAVWVKMELTLDVLLAGMASGLGSTGMHQLVDKLVQGQKEE